MSKRNFDRTAEAVSSFDKVEKVGDWFPKYEAALLRVREAFAEDTADINAKDTAMLVAPNDGDGWLRKLLRDHGHPECALTKEQRGRMGWEW